MSTDRRAFLQTSLAVPAMGAAIAAAEAAPAPSKAKFRRIAVEETFATHEYLEARLKMVSGPNAVLPPNGQSPSDGKLMDLGAGRLADMDAAGVDFQVCSIFTSTGMLPKDISTGIMQRSNDILAKEIGRAHV
mgnify:CR=1 FL=1